MSNRKMARNEKRIRINKRRERIKSHSENETKIPQLNQF